MKDVIIKGTRIKTELWILFVFFVIANLLNGYSIVKYNTQWSELITQIPYVVALMFVLYLAAGIIRILYLLITRLVYNKKTKPAG